MLRALWWYKKKLVIDATTCYNERVQSGLKTRWGLMVGWHAIGALFGFVPARQVGEPTVSEAAIIEQFVTMFGPEAGLADAIHICDWRSELFTSPPGVEQLNAYQMFGHKAFRGPSFGGRLYWTSTETASTSPGHIEGALEAAERTAGQIRSQLASHVAIRTP
jgi:monoamine oxidase